MVASDILTFHPLSKLAQMTQEELAILWELVPTERQRQYKTIYDQFIHSEGVAGSDAAELSALDQLLERHYAQDFMVPLLPKGDHWVRVPKQIREAAEANISLGNEEKAQTTPQHTPMLPMLLVICAGLLVFGLLVMRGLGSRNGAVVQGMTPTKTITPRYSPTPTPIALEAQDDIIRGSNSGSSPAYYPVNLRVVMGTAPQPRVFVVQRRAVQTTEWNFENNPDIASYIAGLNVRPVIGIPWSETNAGLFTAMDETTSFVLQMNTGSTMQFNFDTRQNVNRSDTSWFRQAGPGLVLVLIGERNLETNEPTPQRIVVTASYDVAQELSLNGSIAGNMLPQATISAPTITPTPVQRIDVQLISVTSIAGQVTAQMRIYNARFDAIQVNANQVRIAFGYAANPLGPEIPAEITSFDLQPGQAVDLVSTFGWQGEPFAALNVFDYRFAITLAER